MWRLLRWLPDRDNRHPHSNLLTLDRGGPGHKAIRSAVELLRALGSRTSSELYVLDGLVPTALVRLMDALGCPSSDRVRALTSLIGNQLTCAFNMEELHKLHTICLWQRVGIPFLGVGCEKTETMVRCATCTSLTRCLYAGGGQRAGQALRQFLSDCPAFIKLCDALTESHLAGLRSKVHSLERDARRKRITEVVHQYGCCVCFACAIPVLGALHIRLPAFAGRGLVHFAAVRACLGA